MKLKTIFGDKRIVAVAGEKHTGKTNNIVSLILDFRTENKDTPIFAYGLSAAIIDYLKPYNVIEISDLLQLINKKDCILILDEYQRLNLNDHRYRKSLNEFVDFVYHNNVYVLLCSPNIREFNSIIGGKIERWIFKTVYLSSCINGSQLKKAVLDYKGKYKTLNSVVVPHDTLLIINENQELTIKCEYVPSADTKKEQIDIFVGKEKNAEKIRKKKTQTTEEF